MHQKNLDWPVYGSLWKSSSQSSGWSSPRGLAAPTTWTGWWPACRPSSQGPHCSESINIEKCKYTFRNLLTTHFPVSSEGPPTGFLRLESFGILVWFIVCRGHRVIGDVDVDHRPLLQLLLLQLVHVDLVTPVGQVVSLHDDVEVILKLWFLKALFNYTASTLLR